MPQKPFITMDGSGDSDSGNVKISPAPPEIIFENKDFLVINKPAGLMVHGVRVRRARPIDAARAMTPTLVDWLRSRYPEIGGVGDDPGLRPGIVHRLDKATSGVMIVAKTQSSFELLKRLFQEHQMEKTYFALVFGVPKKEQGIIDSPIGIKRGSLKRSIYATKMAKPAVTEYSVVKKITGSEKEEYALLKVNPKTGRTHQIRVHLASIGHPIVGDAMYGKKIQPPFARRLMLHAASLEFSNGAGSRFVFEAPLPPGFTYPQGR
jgi:23S rRNA pseudouridine1911/1915/1917 synthase